MTESRNTKPVTGDCQHVLIKVEDLGRKDKEIATLRADNARLRAQVEAVRQLILDWLDADSNQTAYMNSGSRMPFSSAEYERLENLCRQARGAARDAVLESVEKEKGHGERKDSRGSSRTVC